MIERLTAKQSLLAAATLSLGFVVLLLSDPRLRTQFAFWQSTEDRILGRAVIEFNAHLGPHGSPTQATPADCDFMVDERPRNESIRVFCAKRISIALTAFATYFFAPDGLFDFGQFTIHAAPQETL